MKKFLCTVAALALLSGQANASIFGDGFGINIKNERITDAELKQIAAMGIKRVRISVSWYAVEQQAGQYRWDINIPRREDADDFKTLPYFSYDYLFAMIRRNGLKIDCTLHEGNAGLLGLTNVAAAGDPPSYRHNAPQTDAQLDMFAGFAAATAAHFEKLYGTGAIRWHIWNEPDTDGGFPPRTNGATVGLLATRSCQAIKKLRPQAGVMGVALGAYGDGDLRYDFMEGMFSKTNPLTCLNGFTVHPYRSAPPEDAMKDYARIARLLAAHNPNKAAVPVAVDEWGYSVAIPYNIPSTQKWRDYSENEQAYLMLRMYLTNLFANVPLTVIYDWRDNGTDPHDWEHHFGVVDYDGKDKAAARMFRFVWPTLTGRALTWAQPIQGCSANEKLLRFGSQKGDGTNWTLLWTIAKARPLAMEGRILQMVDIYGNPINPTTITGSPILVQHPAGVNPTVKCVP